ncbi:MAG: HAMP domain-containing sensor histidine kinase [bacterium]
MIDLRRSRGAGECHRLVEDLDGLRPSLDAILARVNQLLQTPLSGDSRQHADSIARDARSLLARVGSIRDVAELTEGHLGIREIEFSPAVALRAEIDRLAPLAEGEGLDLSLRLETDLPARVVGDPSRIRQALEELVRFAVDHTPRGSVEVRAGWAEEDVLRITVEDTGVGTRSEHLERVLAGEPSSHGLAFARELVELMGGTLVGRSRLGLGSRFDLELPLERAAQSVPLVHGRLAGSRILFLGEEDPELEERLESLGARTMYCGSSTQALRRLRETAEAGEPFDLLVANPPFSGPDALTFGSLVQGDTRLRSTELVLVAPAGQPGDAARLEAVGWRGYFTRPSTPEFLTLALATVLGTARNFGPRFVTRHLLAECEVIAEDEVAARTNRSRFE